jgi:lipoprotein-anchoring transpeptidase ErfK/SrfK
LSSGREGFSSPTGSFKIQLKDRDHKSSLYGDYVDKEGTVLMRDIDVKKDPKPPGAIFDGAKMPFFMKITGGVGMHEGFLPGYPASHGCIRMPGFMAEKFFENVQVGTPVVIVP